MKKLITIKLPAIAMLFVLATLASACGGGTGTPDQAVREFLTSLKQEEYAAAVDQLSTRQQESLRQELQKIVEDEDTQALAWLNKQFGTAFEIGDLRAMEPAEFFAEAMQSARSSDPSLADALDSTMEIGKARMQADDRAVVRVSFGDGSVREFSCRREAGAWRMDFAP